MTEPVIVVESVAKKYCRSLRDSMLYGVHDIARNLCGLSARPHELRAGEFWGVDDVSFEVARGESVGIIGRNGSGKTTLLKCLSGIFGPDRGRITIRGRVGALIAVGAGFHPMLTGRENVYINAAILGMTEDEVAARFDSIVDFAGIGEFIDMPVKSYSSGMYVRLGFAVACHAEPDILLVDEVLAVGDMNFQRRCQERIKTLRDAGVSIVFISHNMNQVLHVCDRVIYLAQGRIVASGGPAEMIERYQRDDEAYQSERAPVDDDLVIPGLLPSPVTGDVEILSAEVTDAAGSLCSTHIGGEDLHVRVRYESKIALERPAVQVAVYREDGVACIVERSIDHGLEVPDIEPGTGELEFCIPNLPLKSARYIIEVLVSDDMAICAHAREPVASFRVVSGMPVQRVGQMGMFSTPVRFVMNGKALPPRRTEGR